MSNDNKTFFAKGVSASKSFSWKDIFSDVFKKHSKADMDASFSAGLTGHIPSDDQLLTGWQKPWMFSRFLIIGIAIWVLISVLFSFQLSGTTDVGSMFLIPAAIVPITVVLFFWEMNIPRNIPIYKVLKLFIYSGVCTSIIWYVITLFINNATIPQTSFLYWIIVGVVEEAVKLVIIAIAIRKAEYCWGLNGLLIGAAVGCGFAVFETVGYAFNTQLSAVILEFLQHPDYLNIQTMDDFNIVKALVSYPAMQNALHTLNVRGIVAINGHVVWAAMYGGALALAKGRQKLQASHFGNPTFLITFFAAILLHALFDFYDQIISLLFEESNPMLFNLLNIYNENSNSYVPVIIMSIIFAIPSYAIVLWLLRKSVNQVVTYASSAGHRVHVDQVYADSNYGSNAAAGYQSSNSYGAPSVLSLECVSGELAGQSYTIQSGRTFTIGRGQQNNIQYSDGAKGISRSHCSVTFDGRNAVVVDLGSSHGTFFANGAKFQPQMRNPMNNGDTFYLASPKNTFRIVIR